MNTQFQKRRWKQVALQGTKRIDPNPLFPRAKPSLLRTVLPWLIVAFAVSGGAIWAVFFSTWFDATYIIVEGNRTIPSDMVEAAVKGTFATRRFGMFPQGNTVFFSPASATPMVLDTLQHVQALESIVITKTLPARIDVVMTERTPHLRYINGGTTFLLDREGVIAKREDDDATGTKKVLGATTDDDAAFPKLYDQNGHDVAVGAAVVTSQFVDALFALDAALRASDDIVPLHYSIPPLRCFDVITPEPEEVRAPEPTNTNQEQGTSAVNGNAKKKVNANVTANTNDNENVNSAYEEVVPIPEDRFVETECAIGDRVRENTELRATTADKWDIYLRTDQSVTEQLARMYRVIDEQHIDRTKLDYIDLRFGERVIYK